MRSPPLVRAGRWLAERPLGALSIVLIAGLVALALFAPALTPFDPLAQDSSVQAKGPSAQHPLGTDYLGRDVLSRVIVGSRPSLMVGLASVAVAIVAGSTLGLISGYVGGTADLLLQRVVDVLLTLPGLVLALALLAIVGAGFGSLVTAIAVVLAPGIARVVRSATLVVTATGYIEAARAIGARDARIITRHILPNTLATILVLASLSLGNAILFEAALSFLGLGVQPPEASWGNMLSGPARAYFEVAPWMAIFPGIAVSLAVLGFNLLGDTLRDVFDPRLRGVA
jgi:ABC-type dipeptide/oligopeptide/nickel transport system permease subunit